VDYPVRLTTPEEVKRYIQHPEIFEAIAPDGFSFDSFMPHVGDEDYFLVTAPESMFYLHPFCADVWQIHAHVHPEFRLYALDAGMSAIDFAFEKLRALKLVCLIPEIYPRVRGFAKKCGFDDEGFIAESCVKKNVLCGQHLMGLSRRKHEGRQWVSFGRSSAP
jgi:hypothetical protein